MNRETDKSSLAFLSIVTLGLISQSANADPVILLCQSIEYPALPPAELDIDAARNTVLLRKTPASAVSFDDKTIKFHVDFRDVPLADPVEHSDNTIDRLTGAWLAHFTYDNSSATTDWHANCHAAQKQF